jgi:hypothetical protein
MGKQSGKRRTSAGSTVPNGQNAGQVEAVATVSDGNRQDGAAGLEASGDDSTENETHDTGLVTYAELVAIVVKHNETNETALISRAFHPDGKGENWKETDMWIGTNYADVPVLNGKASYQLSTGEIVEL